jgi:hypothetical protein
VERLIGTIRRECLDHMIVFGEAHLRRILGKYADYYNKSRVHRSLLLSICLSAKGSTSCRKSFSIARPGLPEARMPKRNDYKFFS